MAKTAANVAARKGQGEQDGAAPSHGLRFDRVFVPEGSRAYDLIEWERRTASITNEKGDVIFEQRDVEVPRTWSQLATNVVAQKYFRGRLGTPARESSVKQMIDRVVETLGRWGREGGYFASEADAANWEEELRWLLATQHAAFNSPVWFNIGVPGRAQQASACQPYWALVSTPEGMVPIGRLVTERAVGRQVYDASGVTRIVGVKANGRKPVLKVRLGHGGFIEATGDHLVLAADGAGAERCWLRVDQLRRGMRLFLYAHRPAVRPLPAVVGGGRERTAFDLALDPLVAEAALAGWLQADGFVCQHEHGPTSSLTIELRASDERERRWLEGHLDRALPGVPRRITRVAWCGPSGQRSCWCIRLTGEALRPFVERWSLLSSRNQLRVPTQLWTAPSEVVSAYLTSVFTAAATVVGGTDGDSIQVRLRPLGLRWTEDIQILLLSLGIYSHRDVEGEGLLGHLVIDATSERARFAELVGFVSRRHGRVLAATDLQRPQDCPDVLDQEIVSIEWVGTEDVYDIQTESGTYLSNNVLVHNCFINSVQDTMESILDLAKTEGMLFKFGSGTGTNLSVLRSSKEPLSGGGTASGPVSFMRGYDAFAGSIKSGGTTRRAAKMVILNADHPDILDFITCKAEEEKKAWALIEAGYDPGFNVPGGAYDSVQFQNANHSVRVSDEFMRLVEQDGEWTTRAVTDGHVIDRYRARDLWRAMSEAAWTCGDPGLQFDDTIQDWNCVPNTGRINATNPCAEFVFVDDTACNLLSLNLLKYQDSDGRFDVDKFQRAIDICFTAQEILVSNAAYPTPTIARNSERLRPLGMGYANLGALLMSMGLAYDSDEGRRYAGAITAIMTARAYAQSARMAAVKGPFAEFEKNREAMLRVMRKHRAAAYQLDGKGKVEEVAAAAQRAWDEAVALGERHGYRNAQATVIAPTGCLVGDTLVLTDRGLVRLQGLGNPDGPRWQRLAAMVATDQGPRQASRFYVNGAEPVVTVETSRGYRLQGTPSHRVRVVDANGGWRWRRLADLQPGDQVPLMLGGMVGEPRTVPLPPIEMGADAAAGPRSLGVDLAELLGHFMGSGFLCPGGLCLVVPGDRADHVAHLQHLSRTLFGLEPRLTRTEDRIEVWLDSAQLARWWVACGFAKREFEGNSISGPLPHLPDALLQTNDPAVYMAFLRGLLDAVGVARAGQLWLSGPERFSRDVQTLLLALGVVASVGRDEPARDNPEATRCTLRLSLAAADAWWRRQLSVGSSQQPITDPGSRPDHPPSTVPATTAVGAALTRTAPQVLERDRVPTLAVISEFFYDAVTAATLTEEQFTFDLSVPDNVTYVANGFVSHNTIGLMMDCDTTGIEPDLALVKYKKLVGGGMFKIVNNTVPQALSKLGYSEDQIKDIVEYIDDNDTIEGAPHLLDQHLKVFDCAFKAVRGVRSIAPMGHVRMMAAIQPFVSGSMSKTVNLPNEATVEDIEKVYLESWRLGLKCISIYRDGCKRSQPLSTKKDGDMGTAPPGERQPIRRKLPDERHSITHKFDIQGHEGYITVGLYEDGTPGEIFLTMNKEGSTLSGLMDSFATQTSLALQYGVPLRIMVNKFSHMRFEPSGFTKNPEIPIAKSIIDYIFRWLASRFLEPEEQEAVGVVRRRADAGASVAVAPQPPTARGTQLTFIGDADAPPCPECGAITVRNGTCYKCMNCGATTGCS